MIPADHSTTAKALGTLGSTKMIASAGWNYRRTVLYLLYKGRFRDFANFLYTKTLVPTGEGSGELAYYFIGGLLQRLPQLVWYPRNIEIEVTTRCNKRCVICEHTWWHEPSVDLTFDEFKRLVDQSPLRWVNLTGEGDAFLNNDYLRMIEYLKRRGTSVYLVDSMDLVTSEVSRELVKLGADGIYISMDASTKATYESIKVGCNFDKVLENIQGLLEVKRRLKSPLPELCFRFAVTKTNVHEMPDFVRLVRALGTRKDFGDGSKIHFAGLLDYPEIHDLHLEEIPQTLVDETLRAADSIPVVFAHTGQLPSINRCLAWGEPYFALVPTRMVLPCCAVLMSNNRQKLLEYSFGDYAKEPLRDIWNSPYYRWFRKTVTKKDGSVPALCKGCRAYDTHEREQKYGIDYRKKEDFA
jgi:MoaA/NifB/PqqE/SkfB family radical SAM enzyme